MAVLCIFLSSYPSPTLLCRQLSAVSFQNNKFLLSSFLHHPFLSISTAITLILISSQLQQPPYLHLLPLFPAACASHQIHANQPTPNFAYEAPHCLRGKSSRSPNFRSAKKTSLMVYYIQSTPLKCAPSKGWQQAIYTHMSLDLQDNPVTWVLLQKGK